MKKIFKMLHTCIWKIMLFYAWETQFPPRGPILGNVIESLYVLIVA